MMSKQVGERSSRSLRGERNEERDGEYNSNLNSDYSSYRIQVLITKEWARVVPGTGNGN